MEVDSSEIERSDLDADSEVRYNRSYLPTNSPVLGSGWGCDEEWSEEILLSSPDKPAGGGVQRFPLAVQQQQAEPTRAVRPSRSHQQVEEMEHQHHRQSSQSGQSRQQSGGGLGQAQQDQVRGDGRPRREGDTERERRAERPQHWEQPQSELGGFEFGRISLNQHLRPC